MVVVMSMMVTGKYGLAVGNVWDGQKEKNENKQKGWPVLVMVVRRFSTFCFARGCGSAASIVIGFDCFVLDLAALAFDGFSRRIGKGFVRCAIRVFAAKRTGTAWATAWSTAASVAVRERQRCARGNGAAETHADAISYADIHAAELALNGRLASRGMDLRLGTLDSLWQRRHATSAVHLPDRQKIAR